MRGWLALGGRLIVVGGTAASATLGGFPDDLLPYRPTLDGRRRARRRCAALLGTLPEGRDGRPGDGRRAGPRPGDRDVRRPGRSPPRRRTAAARSTILGIDPTAGWIGESTAGAERSGRRLIPPRSDGTVSIERRQPDRRRRQQPARRSPCRRSAACSLLLVRLHRPDRADQLPGPAPDRPARVGVDHDADPDRRRSRSARTPSARRSAAAASSSTRSGSSAARPDATEGTRPGLSRGVLADPRHLPGRRSRRRAPVVADLGRRVRRRTARASTSSRATRPGSATCPSASSRCGRSGPSPRSVVPKIHADLALVDGVAEGHDPERRHDARSRSRRSCSAASVKVLKDLAPGEQVTVDLPIDRRPASASRSRTGSSARSSSTGRRRTSETTRRDQTRHMVVDQLTNDPQSGNFGRLNADGPVVLAWGRDAGPGRDGRGPGRATASATSSTTCRCAMADPRAVTTSRATC